MKKLYFFRYLYYWLYVFFSIGIVILLVSNKYALVVKNSPYRFTGMGIILVIILLFYLRNQFKVMIDHMNEGYVKLICREVLRVSPILVLYFALKFAEIQMDNFQFIVLWGFVANIVASVFNIYHFKYLMEIKELKNNAKN